MNWLTRLVRLCLWELRQLWQRRGDAAVILAFFFLVLVLAPLGLGPASATLRGIAPGLIWIAALLATLLAVERSIRVDYADGTLERLIAAGHSAEQIMAAKMLAGWLSTTLPLVIVSPIIMALLAIPAKAMATGALVLAAGSPALIVTGISVSALTAGARQSGALLALLLFPLQLPVLIFGAAGLQRALSGADPSAELQILLALLLGSLPIGIAAGAAALRALVRHGS
jgi:heme exporter protein B